MSVHGFLLSPSYPLTIGLGTKRCIWSPAPSIASYPRFLTLPLAGRLHPLCIICTAYSNEIDLRSQTNSMKRQSSGLFSCTCRALALGWRRRNGIGCIFCYFLLEETNCLINASKTSYMGFITTIDPSDLFLSRYICHRRMNNVVISAK